MSGKFEKQVRRKARKLANAETAEMVPQFKAFVNTQLNIGERMGLAWKIIWKRF
jgi:hypothetical protein